MNFNTAKYYEDEGLLEFEANLTNGSYLKYVSLFDGDKTVSFSAKVENVSEGLASLKVKLL